MTDLKSVSLTFRVDAGKARRLEELARSTDRPRSWLLERALDQYLEIQAWQVAHIKQGLDELEAGGGVAHDRVKGWLETWGGENEAKPPK